MAGEAPSNGHDFPARVDRNRLRRARLSVGGGPCGEWVDRDGRREIELTGVAVDPRTTE
jgi:hypothetical protein